MAAVPLALNECKPSGGDVRHSWRADARALNAPPFRFHHGSCICSATRCDNPGFDVVLEVGPRSRERGRQASRWVVAARAHERAIMRVHGLELFTVESIQVEVRRPIAWIGAR